VIGLPSVWRLPISTLVERCGAHLRFFITCYQNNLVDVGIERGVTAELGAASVEMMNEDRAGFRECRADAIDVREHNAHVAAGVFVGADRGFCKRVDYDRAQRHVVGSADAINFVHERAGVGIRIEDVDFLLDDVEGNLPALLDAEVLAPRPESLADAGLTFAGLIDDRLRKIGALGARSTPSFFT
jgi:hypothetical protein